MDDVPQIESSKVMNSAEISTVHVFEEKTEDPPKTYDSEAAKTVDSNHGKVEEMVVKDSSEDRDEEPPTITEHHVENKQDMYTNVDVGSNSEQYENENGDNAMEQERTASKTSQRHEEKKQNSKKGRTRKKHIEHDEIDEWGSEDDLDDIDGEPYDEDFDDDVVVDSEMDDIGDDVDSLDEWKMSEKPLDEDHNFVDEDVDSKQKEQEELQEEIKQLKGLNILALLEWL